MRKSSLGRRSSTTIPTRIPSLGASGQRRCSTEKRTGSMLRQPGFSNSKRSQSADRESYGGRMPGFSAQSKRSLSADRESHGGRSVNTMATPSQNVHANLPTGSARPHRSQTMSTDSGRRMSSFGGTKSTRKDARPISEKSFQQNAQAKVQSFLENHCDNFVGSIRPMNTLIFIDIMNLLLKYFDNRIVITKSNYLEELPGLLKKLGYRLKCEKSWLMTVNTPHSWQHVLAVMTWLIDLIECSESVNAFDMMYTDNLTDSQDEEEDDDFLKVDKNVIEHLKRTFRCQNSDVDKMDNEYIQRQIVDKKCTDEDLAVIQSEIDSLTKELENVKLRRKQQLELKESLEIKKITQAKDVQSVTVFIEESKIFFEKWALNIDSIKEEIEGKGKILAKKQMELQKLQEKIKSQNISVIEQNELIKEKADLYRMIQFHDASIREFENSAFSIDMKSAETQRKLEKIILDYNKLIAEKIIVEPRLKDAEVKFTLLNMAEKESEDQVNKILKMLKEEYKNSLQTLEVQSEEAENILSRINQDINETRDELAKEITLLEGLECDLEKQEESINKESSKLKEEALRYQKMANEIAEEISKVTPAKIEEKKLELKQLDNTWDLVETNAKRLIEGTRAIHEEVMAKIKVQVDERNQAMIAFQKKHLND